MSDNWHENLQHNHHNGSKCYCPSQIMLPQSHQGIGPQEIIHLLPIFAQRTLPTEKYCRAIINIIIFEFFLIHHCPIIKEIHNKQVCYILVYMDINIYIHISQCMMALLHFGIISYLDLSKGSKGIKMDQGRSKRIKTDQGGSRCIKEDQGRLKRIKADHHNTDPQPPHIQITVIILDPL